MALTTTQLANKRTRHELSRRSARIRRNRNYTSERIGGRRRETAEQRQNAADAMAAAQEASKAAVVESIRGKRGGFIDGVKSRLFKLMPRRTGGGE